MQDYTTTTETINGVEVTVYGGARRPIPTLSLSGHVTGWRKRDGARTTYAEATCTCNLVGEAVAVPANAEGKTWISVGEEGWIDRLNAVTRAHVDNVTRHAFMVRPAGGDRSRWADRHRVDRAGLILTLAESGFAPEEVSARADEVVAGQIVYGPDGTRFEIARDRDRYSREPLPIV